MKALPVVLLVAICLVAHASAREVLINTEYVGNCTVAAPCWFYETALWANETVPETNDQVLIENIPPGAALFLNSSITLTSLTIRSNFQFIISALANVTLQNITLFGQARLDVQGSAQVYGLESTVIVNSSELSIEGVAFAQAGVHFFLDESSSVWVLNRGYFGLHALRSVIKGSLSISSTAMFASTGGLIEFINKTFSFQITPIIYNATFIDCEITFKQGWRGSLSANLTSSNVDIENTASLVLNNFFVDTESTLGIIGVNSCTLVNQNITGTLEIISSTVFTTNLTAFGPLIIGGLSTINSTSAHFSIVSFQTGVNGEAANLTVNTQYAHVESNGFIPSDFPLINLTVSRHAFLTGPIHIEGSVNIGGSLYIEDAGLVVLGNINVGYLYGDMATTPASITLVNVDLQVDSLRIGNFSTFTANSSQIAGNVTLHHNSTLQHHYSTFTGNLLNFGYIEVRYQLSLGNYTQGQRGVLLTYLQLANRTSGYLNVAGTADIDGAILYSVVSLPLDDSKKQLVVVQSNKGVKGKFQSEPADVSRSNQQGAILYTMNDVYLVFGKDSSNNPASMWWVWFIVAAGIVAVVSLVVLLIKTSRRRDYSRVDN
jgi:hypothetical protein